ncbi:hypothetical protein FRC12_025042 [Ceratobasidium sp. 428]|nr:hypothetical protein FRC12_025042 [Ceratobasidium sp. 428]
MLCLRMIVACLQVATLVVCESIDTFIDKAASQPSNCYRKLTMTKFAVDYLSDRMVSSVAGGLDRSLDPFITSAESVTLVKLLFGTRHRFLLLHSYFEDNPLAGWSFLLFPAWAHLICGRISPQTMIAPMIGDLACRFSVGDSTYNDEQLVTEFMTESCYTWYQKIMGKTDSYHLGGINKHDSELVIESTASKLFDGSLSLKLSYDLFLWAAHCSNSCKPNIFDTMTMLLEASIDRLWRALGPAQNNLPLSYLRVLEVEQFPGELLRYTQ